MGHPVFDGSWDLRILVTDLQIERTIRVNGDLHVGGLMIRLVDELDIAMDWSDHAMWWPEKNVWLEKTRWTLDQYNITADAILYFTPMHKALRIQLPDLRYIDCNVDFSVKTFTAVNKICSELEIRHPEELSLCKPVDEEHLKFNYGEFRRRQEEKRRRGVNNANGHNVSMTSTPSLLDLDVTPKVERPDTNTYIAASSTLGRKISTMSLSNGNSTSRFRSLGRNGTFDSPLRRKSEHSSPFHTSQRTTKNGHHTISSPMTPTLSVSTRTLNKGHHGHRMGGGYPGSTASEWSLAISPPPCEEARISMVRPKNLVERARLNVGWLDSSLSLMEQGVRDFDTLWLRFKFYSFYDLNVKTDPVRINLIYEQAKWQILNEEIDCTEEEMMLFSALQLQVGLQANVPQPDDDENEDDLDAALTDLQISLEGENGLNGIDIVTVPTLNDHLRYMRPKRFTLKGYKRHYFVLQDLKLSAYRHQDDAHFNHPAVNGHSNGNGHHKSGNGPAFKVNLKGCEVSPDVNITQRKFGIRLAIPSQDGMSDLWLKCNSESQYARWMAACRLAAKGKTLADPGYESEVKSIQAFLSMQHPASQPVINPATLDINVDEYVAPRFLKKMKSKIRHKILEAHANVKDLNLLEAKMNFIKAWQSLPDYGVSLFVVRFLGERKDELLGVAFNRLMRMNLNTGDHIKTWRYNTIRAWNVNWETKHMMIQLGEDKNVVFKTLSADCKVVHEFIGGYIFLSMRSKDGSQTLDEELFHKLTGGWH